MPAEVRPYRVRHVDAASCGGIADDVPNDVVGGRATLAQKRVGARTHVSHATERNRSTVRPFGKPNVIVRARPPFATGGCTYARRAGRSSCSVNRPASSDARNTESCNSATIATSRAAPNFDRPRIVTAAPFATPRMMSDDRTAGTRVPRSLNRRTGRIGDTCITPSATRQRQKVPIVVTYVLTDATANPSTSRMWSRHPLSVSVVTSATITPSPRYRPNRANALTWMTSVVGRTLRAPSSFRQYGNQCLRVPTS